MDSVLRARVGSLPLEALMALNVFTGKTTTEESYGKNHGDPR
jgi:hypothetical protein